MRILIRADGGNSVGMGHLMRTSVLAGKLEQYAEITYVCRKAEQYSPGVDWLQSKGYKVVLTEGRDIVNELADKKADCLITDSYDVDEEYFIKTKGLFPYTGYIDDLNQHRFMLDFIINQNVYAKDLKYDINGDAKLFLGVEYAMLRKEFESITEKNIRTDLKDILITVGGSDNFNYTQDIISSIGKSFSGTCLHVVIGPFFKYKDNLLAIKDSNIIFHQNADMSALMQNCDVAVTGCGSTIYELAACGVPAIGVVAASNQNMAADKMQQMGVLFKAQPQEIPLILNKLTYDTRLGISKKARQLIDGKGSKRLAEGIINIMRGR